MGDGTIDANSVQMKIIETAATLFTSTGIHGTSLNDIARSAELSKGTLYYYYPAKDALVMDVAQAHVAFLTDVIFAWVETLSRSNDMAASLMSLINELTKNSIRTALHIVLCAECSLDEPELREFMLSTYKKWAVMLEVGTLKVQTKEAAVLRERSSMFFKLLTGAVIMENTISEEDKRGLVRLVLE